MPTQTDDNIVLISAIEHYSYCPRQCALIHVEHIFDDNVFTLRGSMAHVRADTPVETSERGGTVERALPIWSEKYGLQGKADVVEFHADGSVYPVEYKLGGKKPSAHDDVQLCAQAICLEEMLGRPVIRGAVYSSSSRSRREVEFTDELRARTLEIVESIRSMLMGQETPEPVDDSRCPNCSLVTACMPSVVTALAADWDIFAPVDSEVIE